MRISDWSSDVCSSDLTHRDDELWAITAFLLRLPELSPEEYRSMTKAGDATSDGRMVALAGPVQNSATACARCHGIDGAGRAAPSPGPSCRRRSEEHTSELQSLMRISYAVFCLKKKKRHKYTPTEQCIDTKK